MAIRFERDQTLLFIGDSITDCGRHDDAAESIGNGYVRLVRDWLLAGDPARAPRVANLGTSGHKITDLAARWQADVIDRKPDVLSVYVGINDVWHSFAHTGVGTPIDAFYRGYRDVLTRTRQALPRCEIVICEPSVLWLDDRPDAHDLLAPYVAAARAMAMEFDAAAVVPLHGAFVAARAARPDVAWTSDGVHPTSIGHALIARAWLDAVGAG